MDITISNGILTAIINPNGAELTSLKDGSTEYMWEGDANFWGKHSPVLFPIVGTLKNNSYLYNGQVYVLSRHGFARDNVFTVKEQTEDSVVFTLASNDDTKKVYPFDFELELAYTLNNQTLTLEYRVYNNGNNSMPFSIGAHPAFALPGSFESYSLAFEKNEPLVSTQLEDDLLSTKIESIAALNGIVALNYTLFENDALIFTNLESRAVTIKKNDEDVLKVSFPHFPHLGIWTKQDAPFVCIEPWQGYSDAQNASGNLVEKAGIINLEPAGNYKSGFSIQIL
ncbi:MAG: aldose 1-epimerase family protein [Bacteroidota bacterium]